MNSNGPRGGGRRFSGRGWRLPRGVPPASIRPAAPDAADQQAAGNTLPVAVQQIMPHIDPMAAELTSGRIFLGALSREGDLLRFLHRFCRSQKIRAGLFSLSGSTRSATVGIYDPSQQVYATRRETGALDIVFCSGTILPAGDDTAITARILLCGENRGVSCGRLFSETPVEAGEFEIRELLGPAPERIFDPVSARMGLQFLASTNRARGNRTPEAGTMPSSSPPRQK